MAPPPDPLRGRPPKMFPPLTKILAAPLQDRDPQISAQSRIYPKPWKTEILFQEFSSESDFYIGMQVGNFKNRQNLLHPLYYCRKIF